MPLATSFLNLAQESVGFIFPKRSVSWVIYATCCRILIGSAVSRGKYKFSNSQSKKNVAKLVANDVDNEDKSVFQIE